MDCTTDPTLAGMYNYMYDISELQLFSAKILFMVRWSVDGKQI